MPSRVLIWGGSGGIGAAIARRLAQGGQPVHLAGRNAAGLAEAAASIDATWTEADATVAEDITRATAEAAGPSGALQGLVYAVGTINLKPLGRLTLADFEADMRVNAFGAALAIQAALPALRKGDGAPGVVLFSTVAVSQGFAAHASVSMAKGAIEGLARALAAELAPKIRVNCIAPSLTRTQLAAGLTSNEQMAGAIAGLHAIPRLGEPDDIAPLAALLVSQDSGWITGQVIGVDGGRSTLRTRG